MPIIGSLGAASAKGFGFGALLAVTPVPTDAQFNYVTMLLHGDGTNGAQNNTFVDSSSNAFTVTRYGNATQGSANPFGNLWSTLFNGTSDYFAVPTSTALSLAGDFTFELWIYSTLDASSTTANNWFYIGPDITMEFANNVTGNALVWYNNSNAFSFGTRANLVGAWHHIAVTRSGTTLRGFVDGVQKWSTTDSQTYNFSGAKFGTRYQGSPSNYWKGYASNFRIVAGTALYTAAFTPSTSPLTAVSGTALLTCQNSYFKDNSSNNFAITVYGNTTPSTFAPFSPGAAYSTTTNGGSGYFDGSGDYLTVTGSDLSSGSFTIEGWVYFTDLTTNSAAHVFTFGSNSSNRYNIWVEPTGSCFSIGLVKGGSFYIVTSTTKALINTWYHFALVYSGTSLKMYINGVLAATNNNTIPAGCTGWGVGTMQFGPGASDYLKGYVSNFRVVTSQVYTSNFTPPTAPVTAITGTSLLLNFTNAGIFDNAAKTDLETVGNAQISTSVVKYGTGSLAFDGTGDWLIAPDSTSLQFGSAPFTIECWVYLSATGVAQGLLAKGTSTTGWLLSVNSSNQVSFTDTTTAITSTATLSSGAWYFIAVVRSGTGASQTKIYINGTNDGTGTSATNFNQTSSLYIGADRTGGSNFNGYLDDVRITNGYARYTANFTPPTAAFPNY